MFNVVTKDPAQTFKLRIYLGTGREREVELSADPVSFSVVPPEILAAAMNTAEHPATVVISEVASPKAEVEAEEKAARIAAADAPLDPWDNTAPPEAPENPYAEPPRKARGR